MNNEQKPFTEENSNGREESGIKKGHKSVKRKLRTERKADANEEKGDQGQQEEVKTAVKMGRPVIDFDWEAFDRLCMLHCTAVEIAAYFDCSVDTVERRVKEKFGLTFAEVFNVKSGKGKVSLRRKQYEVAMSGDRAMLIWIGKNWLGQSEPREPESSDQSLSQLFIEWLANKNKPEGE